MQEIYLENINEVLRNKKLLEKELNVEISNKGKNVFVDGKAENEYLALEILDAVNIGFSVDKAFLLKEEDMILQTINIKDLTKRHDLDRIRGRIIGVDGRTLKTLKTLTKCELALNNNGVGIIGDADEIQDAIQAISSLVMGSKQGNVYSRLERKRKEKRLKNRSLSFQVKE